MIINFLSSVNNFINNLIDQGYITLNLVNFLCSIVCSITVFILFKQLFSVKSNKKQDIIFLLVDLIFRTWVSIHMPLPYARAVNSFVSMCILKIVFKEKIEKCILCQVVNLMVFVSLEFIFSKLLCELLEVDLYINGLKQVKYKLFLFLGIAISKIIIYFIFVKKDLKIQLYENFSIQNKKTIVICAIIGALVVLLESSEMTLYLTNFPYWIFGLNILSLVLYFFVSMRLIYRIDELEKNNVTIHNLEIYNETLLYMYDNIRGFRHDFGNFVQALDGYVKTNNMDGIRQMCKSVLKDCSDVNKMGVLDPNIINNPAIYSIVTNKYYKALNENIEMNVDVLIDLQNINMSIYEFCKILGILLDNAIEAAKECEEKIVNVSFTKDSNVKRNLIIIENSYNKVDIDIDKIFEKGYTTKKTEVEKHGLGLWTVRNILSKNDNLNLFTKTGKLFRQQLEIY